MFVMAVLALGLLMFSPSAMAADAQTANTSSMAGHQAADFMPAITRLNVTGFGGCTTSTAGSSGNCNALGDNAIDEWLIGGYFDGRGGTEMIPPTGDHHRSGWRMMITPNFSAGSWLTGFAPMADAFPHFQRVGIPGAGESPDGIKALCDAGLISNPLATCGDYREHAGAQIAMWLDHHGNPVTPGRFPRYIPHERQGWPELVMTAYVSSATSGAGLDSTLTQIGRFVEEGIGVASASDAVVRWYSMSGGDGTQGCTGGWCEWAYQASSDTLKVRGGGSPGTGTAFTDGSWTTVTSLQVVGIDGLEKTKGLNYTEKAPWVTYQTVGQTAEMDGASGDGQAVWYEFFGLSGVNFQAEEAEDPYTWVICDGDGAFGTANCDVSGGAMDSPNAAGTGGGWHWAFVDVKNTDADGLSLVSRYGADLRPNTNSVCDGTSNDDPATCGEAGVVVLCTGTNGTTTFTGNDAGTYVTADCESDAGADTIYGTKDDGTLYFREALENGLRAFARENRAHAFSFINGIGVNLAQCGGSTAATAVSSTCGDTPSGGTRQAMHQNQDGSGLGSVLSCLNCTGKDPSHAVSHGTIVKYTFGDMIDLADVVLPASHPAGTGAIP